MKSRLTAALLSLILMLAIIVPAQAQATVNRSSWDVDYTFGTTNPCNGHPVTLNIAGEARLQELLDGSGGYHSNFKLRAVMTLPEESGKVR